MTDSTQRDELEVFFGQREGLSSAPPLGLVPSYISLGKAFSEKQNGLDYYRHRNQKILDTLIRYARVSYLSPHIHELNQEYLENLKVVAILLDQEMEQKLDEYKSAYLTDSVKEDTHLIQEKVDLVQICKTRIKNFLSGYKQ